MNYRSIWITKIISITIFIHIVGPAAYAQPIDLYNYQEKPEKLKSEPVNIGTQLFEPYRLASVDKHLILIDASNQPPVNVFNIQRDDSFKLVKTLGQEGRGPGEYLGPWEIVRGNSMVMFYIYDAQLLRLTPYTKEFELLPNQIQHLKTNFIYTDIFPIQGGYIASGITIDCAFEIYYRESDIRCMGSQPNLELAEPVNKRSEASRWHNYATLHPDGNKIALFYRKAARSALYQLDGTLIKEMKDSELGSPFVKIVNGNVVDGDRAIKGYISVTSNSKYIYTLYSGRPAKNTSSNLGRYIHKFDWNLNLVDVYKLDHSAIDIELIGEEGLYTIEHEPNIGIRYLELD